MHVLQTTAFKKAYKKKLHANQKAACDTALKNIIADPMIGEQKKGDLNWLRVYKYMIINQLFLIGYMLDRDHITLTLVALGSHENFYRDMK